MMWKTSFGDGLRSRTEIAMRNELYCKLICHNICCLIKAMYELGLGKEFLVATFQKGAADEPILLPPQTQLAVVPRILLCAAATLYPIMRRMAQRAIST